MRAGSSDYTGCRIALREFRVGVLDCREPSAGANLERHVKDRVS